MWTGDSEVQSVDFDWNASLAVSGNRRGEVKLWTFDETWTIRWLQTCAETSGAFDGITKVVLWTQSCEG